MIKWIAAPSQTHHHHHHYHHHHRHHHHHHHHYQRTRMVWAEANQGAAKVEEVVSITMNTNTKNNKNNIHNKQQQQRWAQQQWAEAPPATPISSTCGTQRFSWLIILGRMFTVDDLDYRNVDDDVGVILQEVTSLIAVLPSGALISNSGHVSWISSFNNDGDDVKLVNLTRRDANTSSRTKKPFDSVNKIFVRDQNSHLNLSLSQASRT